MKKGCGNIYREARLFAGLTIEEAADRIGISSRTLAAYELGEYTPHGEIVCKMCEVYHTDWLAYQHLQQKNPIGQRYLPKIDFSCLCSTVLRLQKEMKDVKLLHDDMVAIACDGKVDEHEAETWNTVRQEVIEMIAAGMALMFRQKDIQKEKAPAFAAAR